MTLNLPFLIKNAIDEKKLEEPRRYIGASSIAEPCIRKLWYGYHGIIGEKTPAKLQITFEIGHRLENMMLEYLENAGLKVIEKGSLFKDCEINEFQGHVDGIIEINGEKYILELKTANDASFCKFKNHGLIGWSVNYYSQIQSYMGMSGIHKAVLLAINKNTSEFHHEETAFDEIFYETLKVKAKEIIEYQDPPERINSSPFYYMCSPCKFRNVCHE